MAARETLRPVAVIGAGLDLGAGRRGVDMGPSAIRYAGLQERIEGLGRVCVDWGDVVVGLPEATEGGNPRARYLDSIKHSCARVASLVDGERALLQELKIRVYTMTDVDRGGLERAMSEALEYVAGAAFVHLSLDLDAVDPLIAPGVGTPVRGGLSYREAHLVAELAAE